MNYDKYIYSTGTHWIANSGKDENGRYNSGRAGDQTGHEWELKAWYSRPWSVVLRYPDINVGLKIADLSCAAALNDHIGYDQYQRTTYWQALKAANYNPSAITTNCEEDCTAGVTANVKAAGVLCGISSLANIPIDTYSQNMRSRFVAAGFKALTDKKYLTSPNYLLPGDILLYEGHHAAANVTYGKYVRPSNPVTPETPVEGLRRGDSGNDVRTMQRLLLKWNPDCLPKYGADGDFGKETETALSAFQKAKGLPVTGIYDKATEAALKATGASRKVIVTGASVYVRSAPNTDGRILGVVHQGDALTYQGQDSEYGWHLVDYENQNGWISGKYSRLE